jgi:hypothetical protein
MRRPSGVESIASATAADLNGARAVYRRAVVRGIAVTVVVAAIATIITVAVGSTRSGVPVGPLVATYWSAAPIIPLVLGMGALQGEHRYWGFAGTYGSTGVLRAPFLLLLALWQAREDRQDGAAQAAGLSVRAYVSCVIECPYSGRTEPGQVAGLAAKLLALGCYEISLGDTTGRGTPTTVAAMLDAVLQSVPAARLAGHFHDTGGRALQNVAVSLDRGLRVFDSAAGGLGGCPFAPGASGNVATEAVVAMLHATGLVTGIDTDRLARAAAFAQSLRTL